jgi:hypothetical protein
MTNRLCVISRFRRHVDEIYFLLGYYAAPTGNSIPTFRDILWAPCSRNKKSKKKNFLILEDGTIGCAETSVQNYRSTLRNAPEEHRLFWWLLFFLRASYSHGYNWCLLKIHVLSLGTLFFWQSPSTLSSSRVTTFSGCAYSLSLHTCVLVTFLVHVVIEGKLLFFSSL